MSEREPELGLGVIVAVDKARVSVDFRATREKRIYATGTPVLRRVRFRTGETLAVDDGSTLLVEAVEERDGLLHYAGQGRRISEAALSDKNSAVQPGERLMAGQADPCEVFDLRYRALQARARFRESSLRGFLGGRLELLPHQYAIAQEVSSRQIPRALLADEVGLGKTIEACLIMQRLMATGKARRVLVLVPEPLIHQWFVELLRRFNLWFGLFDEKRCQSIDENGENPFLSVQLALGSIGYLSENSLRAEQAVEAGWDLVVVDEAHHLTWSPEAASPGYALVERLARMAPGLLLLTATPTQLGPAGHFARLRLLDPARYGDYERFVAETERYAEVARIAGAAAEGRPLQSVMRDPVRTLFGRAAGRIERLVAEVEQGRPGAREEFLRTLLDQHGTGRVMFRNSRAAIAGFPKRKYCPVPLAGDNSARLDRIAREFEAEETGADGGIRYFFKDDPRIDWLAGFLRAHREDKVLLICRTRRKALAVETALQGKMSARTALFHEDLPLVQRDRNAAWFAEPDGAQLLICSEIGSEGRNFQFAHHLVLFDLPLNPGLVEQRIGRLDRIGQAQTVCIHVPYITGSADHQVAAWYHRGVDAFERPLQGGDDYQRAFKARLVTLAVKNGSGGGDRCGEELDQLVVETAAFRKALDQKLSEGRDRLLEMAAFNRAPAARLIDDIKAADADLFLRRHLFAMFDHFGVRVREDENGDVFIDPDHAYVEGFPSVPAGGMLATFDRGRAAIREDMQFLSADHPVVRDVTDLLVDSPAGTTAFGWLPGKKPNLLLEAIHVLEAVAYSRWHVDQFLAPSPVRVVVDLSGRDLTQEHDAAGFADRLEDADLHRFLERPGFSTPVLQSMVENADLVAGRRAGEMKTKAVQKAMDVLGDELKRLEDLGAINDHVGAEEIELARERIDGTCDAIMQARLRLDSLRLVIEGLGLDQRLG